MKLNFWIKSIDIPILVFSLLDCYLYRVKNDVHFWKIIEENSESDVNYTSKLFDTKDSTVLKNSTSIIEEMLSSNKWEYLGTNNIVGVLLFAWFVKTELPTKESSNLAIIDGFHKTPVMVSGLKLSIFSKHVFEYMLRYLTIILPLNSPCLRFIKKTVWTNSPLENITNMNMIVESIEVTHQIDIEGLRHFFYYIQND
jgi:hypothetical protein